MLRAIQRQGRKTDKPNQKFPHDGLSYTCRCVVSATRRNHASCQESVAARAENDEMLKPATSRNRDLRFPVPGIGRKTSGSQNIKFDMEWYVGLTENEIDCGLVASSDFGKFYLLSLYRNVAFAVKSSPELVASKTVHRNAMPRL